MAYATGMHSQDSSDPTGIKSPVRKHNDPGAVVADRARDRKANAALQLALAGATWDEIAEALGYPTGRTARVAMETALERQLLDFPDRDKMRMIAGERLNRLLRGVWTKAIDPEHPEHLSAMTKAREVVAQHNKLFGLDAPSEVIVHTPTQNDLQAWVDRVTSQRINPVAEYDIIAGDVTLPALEWEESDDLSS